MISNYNEYEVESLLETLDNVLMFKKLSDEKYIKINERCKYTLIGSNHVDYNYYDCLTNSIKKIFENYIVEENELIVINYEENEEDKDVELSQEECNEIKEKMKDYNIELYDKDYILDLAVFFNLSQAIMLKEIIFYEEIDIGGYVIIKNDITTKFHNLNLNVSLGEIFKDDLTNFNDENIPSSYNIYNSPCISDFGYNKGEIIIFYGIYNKLSTVLNLYYKIMKYMEEEISKCV